MIKNILTLLLVAVAAASCGGGKTQQKETKTINQAFGTSIATIKAEMTPVGRELILTGKVESDPDKTVSYTPLVGGVIDRVYFALGDKVAKGEILMDIRSTDLSSLQSELVTLETDLAVSQRELRSAQSMYDDDMISERELLEIQAKVLQAEAALKKTRSDMSVFGKSKGDGVFSVHAPAGGYIITKNASPGSTMSADDPMFTIADLGSVWVVANVYAGDLQFVREGMNVNISSVAYPDEVFTGRIDAVSQVFDPEDKALKARVVMNNKDLKLKPEMSVAVRVKNESGRELIAVPTDIVIFDHDAYFVVVRSGDDFEIRQIVPFDHGKSTTFVASGLNEGDEVVSRNQLLIYAELKGK